MFDHYTRRRETLIAIHDAMRVRARNTAHSKKGRAGTPVLPFQSNVETGRRQTGKSISRYLGSGQRSSAIASSSASEN
jgi:hypothetical protein